MNWTFGRTHINGKWSFSLNLKCVSSKLALRQCKLTATLPILTVIQMRLKRRKVASLRFSEWSQKQHGNQHGSKDSPASSAEPQMENPYPLSATAQGPHTSHAEARMKELIFMTMCAGSILQFLSHIHILYLITYSKTHHFLTLR